MKRFPREGHVPPISSGFVLAAVLGTGLLMACLPSRSTLGQLNDELEGALLPASYSSGETFVQLFEWRWADVAKECETFLAPAGYGAVQISPPNEHRDMTAAPWWQRYQPVSYRLESRSGSEAELKDMIKRCHAVGVKIYADAVINHMAGGVTGDRNPGTGFASSRYSKYEYPGLYSPSDFHNCRGTGPGIITNFQNRFEVQNCELVELSDLKTGSVKVRSTLSGYLNRLFEIGVDGLRIDATKHMPAEDIEAILEQVDDRRNIFLEVIEGPTEPIKTSEYTHLGRVTEFRYAAALNNAFRSGRLVDLWQIGKAGDYLPSERAVVFIDNHDSQRGHGAGGNPLSFKEPIDYKLANAFLLAWPYGQPVVMSSFAFSSGDQGPPARERAQTKAVHLEDGSLACGSEWICEHRWTEIAAMASFRKVVGDAPKAHEWSGSPSQIAFSREGKGFLALNGSRSELLRARLQTGLPKGSYCNILTAPVTRSQDGCEGTPLEVDELGFVTIELEPKTALALHVQRLQAEKPAR